MYADFHPGNFLFLPDGRIGLIDFGFVVPLDGELWPLFSRIDRGLKTGDPADLAAGVKEWQWITDDPSDAERLRLSVELVEWMVRSRIVGGEFDFGDEADFRHGMELVAEVMRKRYCRAHATAPAISRNNFGFRSMLYRLKAKFDLQAIAKEEMKATGWEHNNS